MTPADDLARRARWTPAATAIVQHDERLSYRDLDRRATAFAAKLPDLGAARGDAVTLQATPCPDAIAALFALWRAGCVAVPLHEGLTSPESDRARRLVKSRLHIDNRTLQTLSDGPAADSAPNVRVPITQAIAYVLTSGSSGPPQAFGFRHDAFAASAAAVGGRLRLSAHDAWGLCLSLGHVGGLSLVTRAVMIGASVRLWPSFDATSVARTVLRGGLTHLAVVPVMLRRILDRLDGRQAHPALRCVLVGGAAAPVALLEEAWAVGLPVATTWGMTETASQVATAPPELARRHPGTAGRPLRGIEVRVARPPQRATRAARGATLAVRGPTLASTVVRGPEARPERLPIDRDGWFSTRDLGRIDDDGLVWIEGRADAMIVSGGVNVSPAEVEGVIEALPGVREAMVVGLPDDDWGEVVAAVVEGDASSVTPDRIDRYCRARLARGRCPTRIRVVDALPRTLTGKTMRSEAVHLFGRKAT